MSKEYDWLQLVSEELAVRVMALFYRLDLAENP